MEACVWGRFVGNAWLWKVLDIPAASVRSGNYHTENFVVGRPNIRGITNRIDCCVFRRLKYLRLITECEVCMEKISSRRIFAVRTKMDQRLHNFHQF